MKQIPTQSSLIYVMKKKKRKQFHELADKYKSSDFSSKCEYFEKCGGCMFQDIPYESQLLLKKEYLNELFKNIIEIDKVEPSPTLRYRNRMDMVCAFGKIGLREAGSYKFVTDIQSCNIMQTETDELYQKLYSLLKEKEIEDYNYLNHKGYLRYVVFRQAYFTKEVMLSFVTALKENRLGAVIAEIDKCAGSINILFNDGLADQSFGDIIETNKPYIEEKFDTITYRITPNSFFQSNSPVALEMYRKIKNNVKGKTLDLYSGIGSIALYIADSVEKVTGVEIVEEAVKSAEDNKSLNNIKNTDFILGDVLDFAKERLNDFDTLILDPPRAGMHPKMLKLINQNAPEKIIYMSCNPVSFRDDLAGLDNYKIESFEAFDMFPQTPHVETLAVLKRI